jgi:F1F0 ATPase subunit 2
MMNGFSVIVRLLAGAALGLFFYYGLWLTVRSLPRTRHPVLLTLGSFWIRTLVVIASVLLLMKGRWQYVVVCLVGFLIGRIAVWKALPERTGPNAHNTR